MGRSGQRYPLQLFAYCLMPNQWHMVVRPGEESEGPTGTTMMTRVEARII
jgi:hypothetical protein